MSELVVLEAHERRVRKSGAERETIRRSPRQGFLANRISRRGRKVSGVSYSFECPVCGRLQEELYVAVDKLAVASGLLSAVAVSSQTRKFEALLAASKAAKADCVRIRAEKVQHESNREAH